MVNIYEEIETLIQYALHHRLIEQEDIIYTRNRILALLKLDEWQQVDVMPSSDRPLVSILQRMIHWAEEHGRLVGKTVTDRDLFDTEIMNCFVARPSTIIQTFYEKYKRNKQEATTWFYELSQASNYIRVDRVMKNRRWKARTKYGDMDITINLSKPEKDPRDIARMKDVKEQRYPTCLLCIENEGYAGTIRHPARANHRIIPLHLCGERWFFQYSPYVYYNEHCIVLRDMHVPMKMERKTFERLLDFVDQFPHYFIGSNADLPIVGGSILSHDHFQGGKYTFAIEKAPSDFSFTLPAYPHVQMSIVRWPMSVIRIRGAKNDVLQVSDLIYKEWKKYSDPQVDIYAQTNDVPHNTVTPIARRREELYEMDIVLRNNRTSEQYPYGIFHPHEELHHIKKENIGLIEVMGLAVLPSRLADELDHIARYMKNQTPKEQWEPSLLKHWEWVQDIMERHYVFDDVHELLKEEVGKRFEQVLEHAGVFKRTEEGKRAFHRFIQHLQERNE